MAGSLLGPFGRRQLSSEVMTIGRYPINRLVLNDVQASGKQAEIRPEGSGYVLIDLGSTNGTQLNGQRLLAQTPRALHSGDVITIGATSLTVELAPSPLPPTMRANAPKSSAFAPTQRVAAPAPLAAAPEAPTSAPPPPAYTPPPPIVLASPPAPQKSPARRVLLIVGGSLAVVLVACVALGVIVVKAIYARTPEGVVTVYYSALENLDYSSAYSSLDTYNQQIFTLAAQDEHKGDGTQFFTSLFSCLDFQFGPVRDFSTTLLKQTNSMAAVRVNVTRQREKYMDTIGLIPDQGNWRIALFELPPGQQCATSPFGQQ